MTASRLPPTRRASLATTTSVATPNTVDMSRSHHVAVLTRAQSQSGR